MMIIPGIIQTGICLVATLANSTREGLLTQFAGEISISVYPNPARGYLNITLSNLPPHVTGSMIIRNTQGRERYTADRLQAHNCVDLSGYPAGLYLLRVIIGGAAHEWKVIRE